MYDLPNYGPSVSKDYLKDLLNPDSTFLKVKRTETHPIPKGTRRNYTTTEALNILIKTLKAKGKNECGFNHYSTPNIDWMLRMII